MMTEDSNNAVSSSFLLDDDSRWYSQSIAWISGWFLISLPHQSTKTSHTYMYFLLQYSIHRGWYFQDDATNRNFWYRSSTTDSRELRFLILITKGRMIHSQWLPFIPNLPSLLHSPSFHDLPATTKICAYLPFPISSIHILYKFHFPRLVFAFTVWVDSFFPSFPFAILFFTVWGIWLVRNFNSFNAETLSNK